MSSTTIYNARGMPINYVNAVDVQPEGSAPPVAQMAASVASAHKKTKGQKKRRSRLSFFSRNKGGIGTLKSKRRKYKNRATKKRYNRKKK
jgi:hypothetical protein